MNDIKKNIIIFASGGGSNFKSIHSQILQGSINAEIVLVISNNPNSGAIKYAVSHNIRTFIINTKRYPEIEQYEFVLNNELDVEEPDLIVLAGYMKLIPESTVRKYNRKILNIHPGLLPEFGGKGYFGSNVHKAVLDSHAKESGPTVHYVDEDYDTGPIIAQLKVNVKENDTIESLSQRVLKAEHLLYPKVVKAFCEERIEWKNDKPYIKDLS